MPWRLCSAACASARLKAAAVWRNANRARTRSIMGVLCSAGLVHFRSPKLAQPLALQAAATALRVVAYAQTLAHNEVDGCITFRTSKRHHVPSMSAFAARRSESRL
ncbi:hypothetical protein MRX96_014386 [Rhipicephalus microplus]